MISAIPALRRGMSRQLHNRRLAQILNVLVVVTGAASASCPFVHCIATLRFSLGRRRAAPLSGLRFNLGRLDSGAKFVVGLLSGYSGLAEAPKRAPSPE